MLTFIFTVFNFFFPPGAFGSRGGGRGGGRGGQQRPGKGRGDWQWGPKKGCESDSSNGVHSRGHMLVLVWDVIISSWCV